MTVKPPHSIGCRVLLGAIPMKRLTTLFGVLTLVLFVWASSSPAHAAHRVDCIPASSQAPGHFEGDRDEAPPMGEMGVSHHHGGCSGHQYAAPADLPLSLSSFVRDPAAGWWIERFAESREPDRDLRPPIA
jgi:hypothetical protein